MQIKEQETATPKPSIKFDAMTHEVNGTAPADFETTAKKVVDELENIREISATIAPDDKKAIIKNAFQSSVTVSGDWSSNGKEAIDLLINSGVKIERGPDFKISEASEQRLAVADYYRDNIKKLDNYNNRSFAAWEFRDAVEYQLMAESESTEEQQKNPETTSAKSSQTASEKTIPIPRVSSIIPDYQQHYQAAENYLAVRDKANDKVVQKFDVPAAQQPADYTSTANKCLEKVNALVKAGRSPSEFQVEVNGKWGNGVTAIPKLMQLVEKGVDVKLSADVSPEFRKEFEAARKKLDSRESMSQTPPQEPPKKNHTAGTEKISDTKFNKQGWIKGATTTPEQEPDSIKPK